MFISIAITDKSKRHIRRRLRDLALYLAITALILITVIAIARTGLSWNSVMKLLEFLGFTSFLVGYFIVDNRPWWRRRSYWALTGLLFSAHSLVFAGILIHMETFKPIWFAMILPVEMLVFIVCRNWFIPLTSDRGQRQKKQAQ